MPKTTIQEYVGTFQLNEANDMRLDRLYFSQLISKRTPFYLLAIQAARDVARNNEGVLVKHAFNTIIAGMLDTVEAMARETRPTAAPAEAEALIEMPAYAEA